MHSVCTEWTGSYTFSLVWSKKGELFATAGGVHGLFHHHDSPMPVLTWCACSYASPGALGLACIRQGSKGKRRFFCQWISPTNRRTLTPPPPLDLPTYSFKNKSDKQWRRWLKLERRTTTIVRLNCARSNMMSLLMYHIRYWAVRLVWLMSDKRVKVSSAFLLMNLPQQPSTLTPPPLLPWQHILSKTRATNDEDDD